MNFHDPTRTTKAIRIASDLTLQAGNYREEVNVPPDAYELVVTVDITKHTNPTSIITLQIEQFIGGSWVITSTSTRSAKLPPNFTGPLPTEMGKGTTLRAGATKVRASVRATKDVTESNLTVKMG